MQRKNNIIRKNIYFNFSINQPNSNNFSSSHLSHINWIPIGNISSFSSIIHHGTDIAGIPAILAGMVYISSKYIVKGLLIFSQIFPGRVGVVGVMIASYFWNIFEKSALSCSLACWALR